MGQQPQAHASLQRGLQSQPELLRCRERACLGDRPVNENMPAAAAQ